MTTFLTVKLNGAPLEPLPSNGWAFRSCRAGCLGLIAIALSLWGAVEVRSSLGEIVFLSLLGWGWLVAAEALFAWVGLSVRDDALERNNLAALVALCGGLVSVALTYAGGSLGEGPSYWNNMFSAGLGTGGVLGLWALLELGAGISDSIAEERDLASGIRLCGFLLAVGLVFFRAVAGDWHSASATVRDFAHDGWMALVIWGIALVIELFARPSVRRPFPSWPSCGLVPASLYVAIAVGWLWHLGPWEGMPK